MTNTLEDEVRRIVASMDNEEPNDKEQQAPRDTEQEKEPTETVHIHYFPDAIVILKEDEYTAQVVDSVPVIPQKISFIPAYAICSFYLFLILSCIALQVYCIFNPPTVTITLVPRSQTLTTTGSLQLGRALTPITLSQTQAVPTTGKGHQDARQATGFITLYNGELNSVTIPTGTILTGTDGVQIVTDQDAVIPAADPTANPPVFRRATIAAHAIRQGSAGNIGRYDINQPCCFASVIAKNLTPFRGGADVRNFQTVAKNDIDTTASTLKTNLAQSVTGALQGQLKPQEQLQLLPCAPTVSSDHQPGQEAREVKVSVSETCGAVAYNNETPITKATELLSHQALQHLGTGYSLFGIVQVSITQATLTRTSHTLIFSCQGTWVYGISQQAQQSIKQLIAGKSKQTALKLLLSLPGVKSASIEGDENTKLPKNITGIHFQIIVQRN